MSAVVLDARNEPPRVAYTVSRRIGGAVVRNRVRRRLRAAVREHAALLEPGCAYLVRAGRQTRNDSYGALSDALREAFRAHSKELAR